MFFLTFIFFIQSFLHLFRITIQSTNTLTIMAIFPYGCKATFNACILKVSYFSWPSLRFFFFFFAALSSTLGLSVCSFALFVTNLSIFYYRGRLVDQITLKIGTTHTQYAINNVFDRQANI